MLADKTFILYSPSSFYLMPLDQNKILAEKFQPLNLAPNLDWNVLQLLATRHKLCIGLELEEYGECGRISYGNNKKQLISYGL